MSGAPLLRELGRKAFHMLSLVYLLAYRWIGFPAVLRWMAAWAVIVTALEMARLHSPALNEFLHRLFRGLARQEEYRRFSGVFHTTIGSLVLMATLGSDDKIVVAALFCLAFGDAAAALFGKAFGRHRWPFGNKSLEGSAACFVTCAAVGIACGFGAGAALALAATATAIELLPTTGFFNDNLWLPLGAGAVLRACAG